MSKDMMGLIYTGENDSSMRELTSHRVLAALPVLGRYRVIDFQLSNMVNAGVRNVGIITQRNYHSLMDHLGSGREWDLHGKNDGLFILPPFMSRDNVGIYGGMLDGLRSNLPYLRRSKQEYILLCHSYVVYSVDYQKMLRRHIDSGADITVLYQDAQKRDTMESCMRDYLKIEQDGSVTAMETDPETPSFPFESMETLLLRRELLIDIVAQNSALGRHSLSRDILQRSINNNSLRVVGYKLPGRGWFLDSVQAYYRFNIGALDADTRHELFQEDRPVYTKVRDDLSAFYGEGCRVSGSLVADGCRIYGTVENSVLFRGVMIHPGAVVKDCILMQDAVVEENAVLEHVILDKQATVRQNGRLIGPERYPIVISKNVTI